MKPLEINSSQVIRFLAQFLREETQKRGFTRLILGLSGGLDSSVAAALGVRALGAENLIGVLLPHRDSHPNSLKDAQTAAQQLGIRTRLVDVSGMVDAAEQAFPQMTPLQRGNVMARCRMIALYQISAEENALVLGTSNKSEILLGYGTLFGDLACALNPLGDLYKTQVRALARELHVPVEIQQKVPSADLWAGQSDEGELGIIYAEADRFLVRWVDHDYSREELIAEGFAVDFVDRVMQRVISQRFKSYPTTIARLADLIERDETP